MAGPKISAEIERRVRKLAAKTRLSNAAIARVCRVSEVTVRRILGGRHCRQTAEARANAIVISARIYARTERGRRERAAESGPIDLDLAPEVAERARQVREVGFTDSRGRWHPPWNEPG